MRLQMWASLHRGLVLEAGIEQIVEVLVVQLHKGAPHQKLRAVGLQDAQLMCRFHVNTETDTLRASMPANRSLIKRGMIPTCTHVVRLPGCCAYVRLAVTFSGGTPPMLPLPICTGRVVSSISTAWEELHTHSVCFARACLAISQDGAI